MTTLSTFVTLAAAVIGLGISSLTATAAEPTTAPASQPSDGPPPGTRLSLFLLVGQSNMSGRGIVEPQDREPDPRVWTLDAAGAWVAAVDPIHFDKPKVAGVGLGRSFARAVAEASEHRAIGLVPCAFGGTSLDEWAPGGKLYTDAIARARLAARAGRFVGILWHQGEADVRPAKRAVYPEKLAALLASFRRDLGDETLPVVVGELGRFHATKTPNTTPFNAMLNAFAASHDRVACASSEGLTSVGDDTHFDAASQREFGRRYAQAFLKLSAQPATTRPAAAD